MAPHPNETLVQHVWMAIAQGDVEGLRQLVRDKAEWIATGESPWAGRHEGFEQIVHLLATVGEEMESFDASMIDILASDERVLLLYHVSATIGKRELDCDYLMLGKVQNGLLAEMWSCPMQPQALQEFWADLRSEKLSSPTH